MLLKKSYSLVLVAALGGITFSYANASTLVNSQRSIEHAQALTEKMNNTAVHSQHKIDNSADRTLSMQAEIERLQEEVDNLAVYRDHLAKLVNNQNQELNSLDQQLQDIKTTRQGIVPLMYKMLSGLDNIINTGKPIKKKQRLARLAKLNTMMGQADVSDAEKYRRILEAYQIEIDYGTKLGVYQSEITLASSGQSITVDFLHLGRIAFVARSLDSENYWQWHDERQEWVTITEQTNDIDKAFKMANKQIVPSLISLPVTTAQNVGNAQ
ncbi:MAG: DNA repair exonuclease SbcCD ATPase subunit [Moritella dasanensis]|jgi:DNA repair exonuclease SbcCD ATPase subunit